jgi:hypothetical protein
MTRRASLPPGVRRALRLGAADREHAPAATTVHVAGAVVERGTFGGRGGLVQRCSRCGRVLAEVTDLEGWQLGARTQTELRERVAARFFAEGRLIAEGPTCTYLVSDRPLAADETECELVPAFAWD